MANKKLFKVAASTVDGAGQGLFAKKPLNPGNVLGHYNKDIGVVVFHHETESACTLEQHITWAKQAVEFLPCGEPLRSKLCPDGRSIIVPGNYYLLSETDRAWFDEASAQQVLDYMFFEPGRPKIRYLAGEGTPDVTVYSANVSSPLRVGLHLANDAAGCPTEPLDRDEYERQSKKLNNVDMSTAGVFVVTKRIKRGDEIFVPYGHHYWVEKKKNMTFVD